MKKKQSKVTLPSVFSIVGLCVSIVSFVIAVSTPKQTPVLGVADDTSAIKSAREFFIPFGYSYVETTKTEWTDVPGMQVTVDASKYPSTKQVAFETTVFCPTGNQTIWLRLRNNDYFSYPEVVMTGRGPNLLTSKPFSISGNKSYIVQIKTQLGFPVYIYQARMKIGG